MGTHEATKVNAGTRAMTHELPERQSLTTIHMFVPRCRYT